MTTRYFEGKPVTLITTYYVDAEHTTYALFEDADGKHLQKAPLSKLTDTPNKPIPELPDELTTLMAALTGQFTHIVTGHTKIRTYEDYVRDVGFVKICVPLRNDYRPVTNDILFFESFEQAKEYVALYVQKELTAILNETSLNDSVMNTIGILCGAIYDYNIQVPQNLLKRAYERQIQALEGKMSGTKYLQQIWQERLDILNEKKIRINKP